MPMTDTSVKRTCETPCEHSTALFATAVHYFGTGRRSLNGVSRH
jgi:hypothetical protein